MEIINTIRRVADAILTSFGVVLGLTEDPTRVPVLVPIERDRFERN